ncbi:MAG: hypothetical protein ACU833_13645 [Gammaproteobacteria bacterium]
MGPYYRDYNRFIVELITSGELIIWITSAGLATAIVYYGWPLLMKWLKRR